MWVFNVDNVNNYEEISNLSTIFRIFNVNKLKTPETSCIVITHYQRLLDYIKPDIVHVLYKGRIVKTAGPELALELEKRGYDWIKAELGE